jgi:hypothetical protein
MKEKTETETSSKTFDVKKETKAKEVVKNQEVEKEVVKEVKKDLAPVATQEKKEKPISEMTDAEIEEYVAKRKAALNSFTIKNEDVPMCKLIRASVVPTPQLNQQEVLRSVMYRQNKLERSMKKG